MFLFEMGRFSNDVIFVWDGHENLTVTFSVTSLTITVLASDISGTIETY